MFVKAVGGRRSFLGLVTVEQGKQWGGGVGDGGGGWVVGTVFNALKSTIDTACSNLFFQMNWSYNVAVAQLENSCDLSDLRGIEYFSPSYD